MADIPGLQGAETLNGTATADSIVGFQGNDTVSAGGGNDTVWAGQGNDTVLGGDGNDVLYGDQDRLSTWGYRVFDRDFTSANGQAFTIESGAFRGSGLSTGFDPVGHVNAARGTNIADPNDFGIIYTSTFTATVSGTYFFRTTSDDGSTLRLLNASNTPLTWANQSTGQTGLSYLNNDFHQSPTTRQGSVSLVAGQTYTIEIRVWENLGGQVLSADVQPPGGTWQSLTNNTTFIGTGVYSGNDSLDGGTGNDLIYGEGGADTILGGTGLDTLYGGAGNDQISGGGDADLIFGEDGNDTLNGDEGNDTLYGGAGDDSIFGGIGNDLIEYGAGNDTVFGGDGDDIIDDAPGIPGTTGANLIYGGEGNDLIWDGAGNDTVYGGVGNDSIYGDNAGNDLYFGDAGNDTIFGGLGDDTLDGGADNDTLDGGEGNDSLLGGTGADRLLGGAGQDRLDGGDGADTLIGDTGNDVMTGGLGSDRFILDDNHGNDTITGGEDPGNGDIDVLDATAVNGNLAVNIAGFETGTLVGAGLNGTFTQIERLELGSGNDTVTVASGSDAIQLDGNAGIDRLVINGTPVQRGDVSIDNTASGTFTPGNGGPVLSFGPSETLQLSDILAVYLRGSITTSGSTALNGTIGSVAFEEFEQLSFNIICFTRGTRIRTARGGRFIETLRPGDLVATLDHGLQPIRWIGSSRRVAKGDLAPIRIRAGTLGNRRDLRVSPQHRMLLRGWQAELMFGDSEVLVPAKALLNDHSVLREEGDEVEYFHILFDRHEIIWAEGALTESFHPGTQGWTALDRATRDEILTLFPQLGQTGPQGYGAAARPSLRGFEARTLGAWMLEAMAPDSLFA